LRLHQLRREGRGALRLPLRPPALDEDVLAREIPVLPQPLQECLPVRPALYRALLGGRVCRSGRIAAREIPDPIGLPRLLRVGGDRGREKNYGEDDAEHDFAALHGDPLLGRAHLQNGVVVY